MFDTPNRLFSEFIKSMSKAFKAVQRKTSEKKVQKE